MPGSVSSCSLLLPLLIIAGLAVGTVAGEGPASLRLRHGFEPGSEAIYEFESILEQDSTRDGEKLYHKMTLEGSIRETVVETRADTALIGWLGKAQWELTEGQAAESDSGDQAWISSHRITDRGESRRREFCGTNTQQYARHRAVNQFSEAMQLFATFTERDVSVGESWEGNVLLPLPGERQVGRATTTLIAVDRNEDRTVCELKSEFSSGGGESFDTWMAGTIRPTMTVTGTAEGLFEAERGIWLNVKVDMKALIEGPGFAGAMDIRSERRLRSYEREPPDASRAARQHFPEFENALGVLYEGDLAKSITMLERQETDEKDEDWARALGITLAILRGVKQNEERESADKKLPEQPAWQQGQAAEVYRKAGSHVEAGELERAAAEYERFLSMKDSDTPEHARILAQYRLAGLLVDLGRREDALAAYRAVRAMPAADDYSKKLKKQALKKATALEQAESAPIHPPALPVIDD